MKRIIPSLFAALTLALPASASAEVYFERDDGARFDSDVGAACGALHTAILFQPNELTLEIHDQAPLDYLAMCLTTGPLSGAVIGVVGEYDGTEYGMREAHVRQLAVRDALLARGVRASQLTTWRTPASTEPWAPGRVEFRIVDDGDAALLDTRLVTVP